MPGGGNVGKFFTSPVKITGVERNNLELQELKQQAEICSVHYFFSIYMPRDDFAKTLRSLISVWLSIARKLEELER